MCFYVKRHLDYRAYVTPSYITAREQEAVKEKERERESGRSRRQLGEWTMTKTLGAGSMGKVKLGVSNVTGEKVRLQRLCRWKGSWR